MHAIKGMTSKSLIGIGLPLLLGSACAVEGVEDDGGVPGTTASATGTGGSAATSSGGTGAAATGMMAASTGTGGSSAVATGAGGTTGAGGSAMGAGGAATGAGGTGGSGGTDASGGTGGSGGTDASGGTGASGGTDASGGTGGSPSGPTIDDVVGVNTSTMRNAPNGLDGFLFEAPCSDAGTDYDCANSECTVENQRTDDIDFPIGGDPGTVYAVEFRVRGVVEARNYSNCSRDAGDTMDASEQGGDFWCSGGSPGAVSDYNEYTLEVTDGQVDGQPTFYAFNARNGTSHEHESWALDYTKTVQVQGGGNLHFRQYDSNCRQIKNCGPGNAGASNCAAVARVLNLSENDPAPPASFTQPYLGGAPAGGYGQFIIIDVLSVTVVP